MALGTLSELYLGDTPLSQLAAHLLHFHAPLVVLRLPSSFDHQVSFSRSLSLSLSLARALSPSSLSLSLALSLSLSLALPSSLPEPLRSGARLYICPVGQSWPRDTGSVGRGHRVGRR